MAQVCGVSPRTVTRAFQENSRIHAETRARILEVAEQYGYKPNTAATRLSKPPVRITAVIFGTLPIFADSIADGFRRAYAQLCDFKAELEVLVAYTPEEIGDCCRILGEILNRRACDGLIVVSNPQPPLAEVLERYREARIPVVKMLHRFDAGETVFSVRNDYAMSARMACELLSLTVTEGPVIVFCGSLETTDIHPEICENFREEAARRGLGIAEIFDTHDDPGYAARETERVLRAHPEVRGIYIASANSIEILNVVQRTERSFTVVTSDIFPELAEMIRRGTVLASVFQNEAYQAKTAYQNLYEYIAYKKDVPEQILTRPQIILQSNLEAFTSEWDNDLS